MRLSLQWVSTFFLSILLFSLSALAQTVVWNGSMLFERWRSSIRKKLSVMLAGAALLAAAAPVLAHHSFAAEYDANKPVKLRGTVTKMEWINPHSWIHLEVKNNDGSVANWMVEAGAPNALIRRGWTKKSLPAGTEILVEGYQAKDGANRANGRDITFTDGKKLFVGSAEGGAPDERKGP